jgi:hypothetical protein
MIMALMDEYYATDTSQKQKDSVQYRRSKGMIVGRIPFGTMRGQNGFLVRSPDGVWLLPDGTFLEGQEDQRPNSEAIWRGFGDAVQRCMQLFIENRHGWRKLADLLNSEGYRYRDADGQVELFDSDDVRRILANWVEYGGGLVYNKRQNRRARDVTPANATLNPERAIFDVDLCLEVGHTIQVRTRDYNRNPDNVTQLDASAYPLSKIIFCADCERIAIKENRVSARSYLTGKISNQSITRRYRHDTERNCAACQRSVKAELLESQFLNVLQNLASNPEPGYFAQTCMDVSLNQQQMEAHRAEILQEMGNWKQRVENADFLFYHARISRDKWQAAHQLAKTEIARLQSILDGQSNPNMAAEMLATLSKNWLEADAKTRRALAQSVFERIIYDLDARKIVAVEMKEWLRLLVQCMSW